MPKWTMIFLIRCTEDGNQILNCVRMLEDLLSMELPDERSVIIWLNMDVLAIPEVDPTYVPPANAEPGKNISRFYKLENDSHSRGSRKSRLVWLGNDMEAFFITRSEHVQAFFSQYVIGPGYTGEKNVLFTWGHGMPYGIFWGSDAPDPGQEYDMLNGTRLMNAIVNSFGPTGKKIDVLIMMNCFIQFLDFAYCMFGAGVSYLAGSPAGSDFVGLNYTAIFSALFRNPPIPDADLGGLAVTSIRQPGSHVNDRLKQLEGTTVYTNVLGGYQQLTDLVNQLGAALSVKMQVDLPGIQTALTNCGKINIFYHVVDFFSFVRALKKEFGDSWEKPLIDSILAQQALHFPKAYSFAGNNVDLNGYYPSGFLVCLPDHGTPAGELVYYQMYFEQGGTSPYLSPFVGDKWSIFVKNFI